jgi:hypothetical protein
MSKLTASAIMETGLDKDSKIPSGGEFKLPETRVEAMYAPEMFGERQN